MKGHSRVAILPLATTLKFETTKGEDLVSAKAAARLAGVHVDVLAMGRRLLKTPGEGGVYRLTDKQVEQGESIEHALLKGLRKVAKAFGTGQKAKSYLNVEEKRIVFWMEQPKG